MSEDFSIDEIHGLISEAVNNNEVKTIKKFLPKYEKIHQVIQAISANDADAIERLFPDYLSLLYKIEPDEEEVLTRKQGASFLQLIALQMDSEKVIAPIIRLGLDFDILEMEEIFKMKEVFKLKEAFKRKEISKMEEINRLFHRAVEFKSVKTMKLFVELGMDVNLHQIEHLEDLHDDESSPLHQIIANCPDPELIYRMIEKGADINAVSYSGETITDWAGWEENSEEVWGLTEEERRTRFQKKSKLCEDFFDACFWMQERKIPFSALEKANSFEESLESFNKAKKAFETKGALETSQKIQQKRVSILREKRRPAPFSKPKKPE